MNKVMKEIIIQIQEDISELQRKSVFCYYPEYENTYSFPTTDSNWDTIPLNEVIQLILDHLNIKLENNVQIQEPSVKLVSKEKEEFKKEMDEIIGETKHYICPTCNRYIDEGLTDTPLGGSATVRGEGGDPYP
jgi:hypothetical protein